MWEILETSRTTEHISAVPLLMSSWVKLDRRIYNTADQRLPNDFFVLIKSVTEK